MDNIFVKLSLPRKKKVCGYTVQRLPIGAFVEATVLLKDLPAGLLDACFPGMNLQQALDMLKSADEKSIMNLVVAVLNTAPKHLIALVSALTGVPEDALWNDPAIGPSGIFDILQAFWEVNELGKPAAAMKAAAKKRLPALMNTGSRTLSPQESSSGSPSTSS